ncbi:hypothetical protein BEN47_06045 [Hymenobacter lapidarius]|uniref:PKD-like domain-containing protein n=1 Tax=Hymenobacter lapidarius TaxID=1908237 RepID=A0A1G1SQB2_9BACT|nr:hypothetical protein [Hymenobacter lapidarius]OGX80815.1 hypothetical protein BEN47_06045 [Hymenobacter lapidarius]
MLTNSPSLSSGGNINCAVLWDDTPNGGRITVNIEVPRRNSNGDITGYDDINRPLVARIRSVAGQPVASGSLAVPFCSTSPVEITLPAENFPNVPNEPIPAYLWEVPAGWGVTGATLIPSFVTTPGNFRLYQGTRTIRLTPTPGGDVDLRTFKYSSNCNQTYYPSQPYRLISSPGFFRIQRTPTVAITAGPNLAYCGDRTPRTYTATASQSQGLTGFRWSYPSGWVPQGAATGASIVLVPSGTNAGTVGVTADYNCSPAAFSTSQASLAVAYSSNLTPVVFTALPNLCQGETKTLRVAPVPGAQSYQWTLPSSFLTPTTVAPTAPGSYRYITQGPEITVTASTAPYSSGSVLVDVVAGGSGCGSSSATGSVIVGLGDRVLAVTPSPGSVFYYDQVCANQPIQFTATIDQQQATDVSYSWEVNGVAVGSGGSTINTFTPGPARA